VKGFLPNALPSGQRGKRSPMSLQIRDTLSAGIEKRIRALADRKPVLEAMGLELVSITTRAFSDPALRPSPWPARKNTRLVTDPKTGRQKTISDVNRKTQHVTDAATGKLRTLRIREDKQTWSLLRKSGALVQSIRITQVGTNSVTVGSDRPYAAVHQFGSKKPKGRGGGIPARPFFPVDRQGNFTALAARKIEAAAVTALRQRLGI
jgi:phage gpG-like protein